MGHFKFHRNSVWFVTGLTAIKIGRGIIAFKCAADIYFEARYEYTIKSILEVLV